MNLKKITYLSIITIFFSLSANAETYDIVDDTFAFNNTDISGLTSISVTDDSRAILVNPAAIGIKNGIDGFFSKSVVSSFSKDSFDQLNLAGMYESLNGGVQIFTPVKSNLPKLNKFYVGIAYPILQGLSVGVGYSNVNPFKEDTSIKENSLANATVSGISKTLPSNLVTGEKITQSIDVGLITRPIELFSLGLVVKNVNAPIFFDTLNNKEIKIARSYLVSIGLRPPLRYFSDRITLTADAEWVENSDIKRSKAKFGLNTELLDGIHINGFMLTDLSFKNMSFGFQAGLSFPYLSMGYASSFGPTKDAAYLRFTNSKERNLLEKIEEE
ncbi:MAG: hypothetical protein U0457_00305 [Candidatus Sericytochromatia bacterium]